ncbi:protein of unknown function [Serratia sp. Tan611]|nr:protein of unknown function [Serratia sp. Tan611]
MPGNQNLDRDHTLVLQNCSDLPIANLALVISAMTELSTRSRHEHVFKFYFGGVACRIFACGSRTAHGAAHSGRACRWRTVAHGGASINVVTEPANAATAAFVGQ